MTNNFDLMSRENLAGFAEMADQVEYGLGEVGKSLNFFGEQFAGTVVNLVTTKEGMAAGVGILTAIAAFGIFGHAQGMGLDQHHATGADSHHPSIGPDGAHAGMAQASVFDTLAPMSPASEDWTRAHVSFLPSSASMQVGNGDMSGWTRQADLKKQGGVASEVRSLVTNFGFSEVPKGIEVIEGDNILTKYLGNEFGKSGQDAASVTALVFSGENPGSLSGVMHTDSQMNDGTDITFPDQKVIGIVKAADGGLYAMGADLNMDFAAFELGVDQYWKIAPIVGKGNQMGLVDAKGNFLKLFDLGEQGNAQTLSFTSDKPPVDVNFEGGTMLSAAENPAVTVVATAASPDLVAVHGGREQAANSELPPAIAEAQTNLGAEYKLQPAADGQGYEVYRANGEAIAGMRFDKDVFYYAHGKDKNNQPIVYAIDEHAVKVVDGVFQFGLCDLLPSGDLSAPHTYAAPTPDTLKEVDGWRSLAIKWTKNADGSMSKETLQQVATMFAMRDLAMTQADMKAEVNLPPNFFSGWRGYKQNQFGTMGSPEYLPMKNGGALSEYFSRSSEDKPMKVALKKGDFGVQVFDESGNLKMDLVHAAIVAENPAGDLLSLSALVPKASGGIDQLAKYADVGSRAEFSFVVEKDPKIVDLGIPRYDTEEKTLSDERTREFTVAANATFLASNELTESLAEKFTLPKSLPQTIMDLRNNTGITG